MSAQTLAEVQAATEQPADQPAAEPRHTYYNLGRDVSAYEMAVLAALQRKPQYEGTVPAAEIARRRRRNRVARLSRRINRKAGK